MKGTGRQRENFGAETWDPGKWEVVKWPLGKKALEYPDGQMDRWTDGGKTLKQQPAREAISNTCRLFEKTWKDKIGRGGFWIHKHQAGEVLWPRLPLTEARVVAGSLGHEAIVFSMDRDTRIVRERRD